MDGFVVKYDEEKGYGFIRSSEIEGDKDAFFHINDVKKHQKLLPGQNVSFQVRYEGKGPQALEVEPGRKPASPFVIFLVIATGIILAAMFVLIRKLHLPPGISYLLAVNLAIFLLYGYDKKVAGKKIMRVPELILHLFTLLGGTPMAFVSQSFFHHKTIKGSFRIVFWLIFIVQIVVIWKFGRWLNPF